MFKKIFIKLCSQRNVAPTVVCQAIGLSNAAFSKWTEDSIPRDTTLQKIADYFGVTVQYLKSGIEENNPPDYLYSETNDTMFIERIRELLKNKKILAKDMLTDLGINKNQLSLWESAERNGKDCRKFKAIYVEAIAKYLGTTPKYLYGETDVSHTPLTAPQDLSSPAEQDVCIRTEQEKTLIRVFRETTEEGRLRIIQTVLNICDEIKLAELTGTDSSSAV